MSSSCGELLDRALFVEDIDEDFDPSVPPSTGQEYIKRVVLEASQCKSVVVVPLDRSKIKKPTFAINSIECVPAPPNYLPSREWQHCQVANFAALRFSLARYKTTQKARKKLVPSSVALPDREDRYGWCVFCYGQKLQKILAREDEILAAQRLNILEEGVPPLLSVVTSMSPSVVEQVLEYHIEWLEEEGFSDQQGRWLYALLICLERPLAPETCSILRSLVRTCCKLRAYLDSADHPHLQPLNLFICLVARYFGQNDLADSC